MLIDNGSRTDHPVIGIDPIVPRWGQVQDQGLGLCTSFPVSQECSMSSSRQDTPFMQVIHLHKDVSPHLVWQVLV
jgi:hypothetical protein